MKQYLVAEIPPYCQPGERTDDQDVGRKTEESQERVFEDNCLLIKPGGERKSAQVMDWFSSLKGKPAVQEGWTPSVNQTAEVEEEVIEGDLGKIGGLKEKLYFIFLVNVSHADEHDLPVPEGLRDILKHFLFFLFAFNVIVFLRKSTLINVP